MQQLSLGNVISKERLFLILVFGLSSFTHLWNAAGFPDIFFDEGVYMRRAIQVMEGLGVQERSYYDHPYFGQLFLAGFLSLANYPQSLNPATDVSSIASLYEVPRILMGLLAVADTFLIYDISKRRYNAKIAVVAALLFAVMPVTWPTRRILLDSILLPFMLSSILLAIRGGDVRDSKRRDLIFLASGALLGIAIFTKAPAFLAFPVVGYLVYSASKRDSNSSPNTRKEAWKNIGFWIIPAILIPLLWPIESITAGQFDLWLHDVVWQAQRGGEGIVSIALGFFKIDPVIMVLGSAALIYAGIRKDYLVLLWIIPFLLFFSSGRYVNYVHWIPVFPVLFIAIGRLIVDGIDIAGLKLSRRQTKYVLWPGIIIAITAFGFTSTTLLITTDLTSAQFAAASYVMSNDNDEENTTIISSASYSWLFLDVFDKPNVLLDYRDLLYLPVKTSDAILVYDAHYKFNIGSGDQLQEMYDRTHTVAQFRGNSLKYNPDSYPYTYLFYNPEGSLVEIRMTNAVSDSRS